MAECLRDDAVCGTDKCSGCGACAAICPKSCIKMELNENGFYRPLKDMESCVSCRLCDKVCPQLNIEGISLDKSELYSAYVNDKKDRIESSSGGIAFQLADYGVHNDYRICGVVMNYDKMQAEHAVMPSNADIAALKGSKYLQSNTSVFSEVIGGLQTDEDLKFIVFGTPCQIAGLNQVLKRKKLRDRAFLIDIFCHGVPSDLLWRKYSNWLENKKKVKEDSVMSITFRDKNYSWHKYYMHITARQKMGGVYDYVASTDKDPFLKLFTMGAVNQKSCFTCPYRNQSAADLRLGDYWGERYKDTEEGVSMVLVNTLRGIELLNAIKNQIVFTKQDITERLGQQHTNYQYPKYYDVSFEMLLDEKAELQSIINLYESDYDRLKIKIKKIVKAMLGRD